MRKAVLLILGFATAVCSCQALADPPGQMKMQYLISSPMGAIGIVCSVLNLSEREIEVTIVADDELPGSPFPPVHLMPGKSTSLSTLPNGRAFCLASWYGRPGELIGSACAEWTYSSLVDEIGYGCLDLREFDYDNNQG